MKITILKLHTIFLLLLPLCVAFLGAGCNDDKDEYSDYVEGYIVGSFIGDEVNAEGQATGNKTGRGYCILLEGSENEYMDFYTFNFQDTLFAFPDGVISSYNAYNCGPAFFPDSLKYAYKIKFKYQIVDEQDRVRFITGACLAMGVPFPWEDYNQVILNGTTKD